MYIADIPAAERLLQPYFKVAAATAGRDITIARTQRLMAHMGNPERSLRVVHVAGTSGKTSTTYYTAALLRAAGVKVGHTVSPHVDSIAERVQINGRPLTERRFCDYLGEFLDLIADAPDMPSWFECLMGFAYWVFARERVDYAVIETGLGGLHDSSNVADRSDKLCIITDIGYDHMHVLGSSLAAIARQKAGIIHPANTAVMYEQPDKTVMAAIRTYTAAQTGAVLQTYTESSVRCHLHTSFVKGMPAYQQRNWLLAYAACGILQKRGGLPELTPAQLSCTQTITIPARLETSHLAGKTIIMDGAHNAQKMQAMVASFQALHPGIRPVVLIALKQGKEIDALAPVLAGFASRLIVTTFSRTPDLPLISANPDEIASVFAAYGIQNVYIEPNQARAYELFLDQTSDIGVITGSFFLIAQLRTLHAELTAKTV